ncbi:MAG: hypothetical protein A2283_12800 [Lentisphaerae bacterium RIFOXYA12_FULL_48_11]|nr:MAG: hypothetical protein A2283_12800 [Lentisphaerae bacterium RIFOXYA12_FULL_48_11]
MWVLFPFSWFPRPRGMDTAGSRSFGSNGTEKRYSKECTDNSTHYRGNLLVESAACPPKLLSKG